MNKVSVTLVLSFLLFAINAKAQFKFVVAARQNNSPLLGVTAVLQNTENKNNSFHAVSDSLCKINFGKVADGNYTLNISYVGYEPFFVGLQMTDNHASNLPDTIQLSVTDKNLKSVTVSATTAKPFIQFSANNITLNVSGSPVGSTGSAYDALKHGPGIMADMNGNLTFRGKSVTVLIDGINTNLSSDELQQLLQNTPASDVEKIEIMPNPSAKYDANAATIVNIVFTKNPYEGLNGTVLGGIGGGINMKYTGGLSLNYRKKNLNIYGSYNYERYSMYINQNTDRLLTATDHILENNHDMRTYNNHNVKLGLDYNINKNNTIGFLVSGYDNFRGRTSTDSVTLTHAAPVPDSFSMVSQKGHAVLFNPTINVYYKSKLDSSGKTLTVNANYMNYHRSWWDNYNTNYYDIAHNMYQPTYYLRDSSPIRDNIYSLSADYVNPIKNGSIQAGLKTTYTVTDNNILWQYLSGNDWLVDADLTNHFVYKENVNAGYFIFDKTWGKYEVNAGLRAEQTNTQGDEKITNQVHDTSYWGLFPSVSLTYTKNSNNQFSLSYRKTVNRPDFSDVNPFIVYESEYSFYTGNPDLLPEYDHDITFTYTYKQNWNMGIDYNITKNAIANILVTGQNSAVGTSWGNVHTAMSIAPFISWTGTIAKIWNVTFSNVGQYAYFKQTYPNGYKLDNSGWTYLGQLQNTVRLGKGWLAELDMMYRSSVPDGTYYVKPTFRTDFGLQKTVLHGNGKLALSASDIFNTDKTNYTTNFMGIDQSVQQKQESRYVLLQFTYRFGNKNVKPKVDRENTIEDVQKRLGGNEKINRIKNGFYHCNSGFCVNLLYGKLLKCLSFI